jgi:hypothetical protein
MQYPQAYLFIKNNGQRLDFKRIKNLANNAPIYISKQSRYDSHMERSVGAVLNAASVNSTEWLYSDVSTVVIPCTAINVLLLMAIQEELLAVCWLDDADAIEKIENLHLGYRYAKGISHDACELLDGYDAARNSAGKYLQCNPLSDTELLDSVRKLASRQTELQSAIKLALRAAIRQGILNRIDLQ